MRELKGRVAVITGAASGLGRSFALACAREGMHLMLLDVDEQGLQETAQLLPGVDAQGIGLRCDVSRAEDLERAADQTYARFGAAHLLFNNAGVGVGGPVWKSTLEDWKWTLDVNLMGVVHGIRSFVPRMLNQGSAAHIVNTSSFAGLISVAGMGAYCASKHAVVALSESLLLDLQAAKAEIGVSVLCPAFVPTRIADSARNRPAELEATNPDAEAINEATRQATASGRLSADDVARITLEALRADRFYVIPHTKAKRSIEQRMRGILDDRNPT